MTQRLSLILALKAFAMLFIILYAGIGLGPDEAQYWTWSQALDWGYYSKPPGIAWQIWLGTTLFGQNEWGVRSMSVILGILQAFAVYRLALYASLSQRAAYWSALFMAFTPLGILGSFFAITDVGFLLCWTGACLAVIKPLQRKEKLNPLWIGLWILGGSLFKWPIYCFWGFVFLCRPFLFPQLKIKTLLLGVLISLLGLLPSLWWNGSHDWATFRHVFATVQGGSSHKAGGNVAEFLGAQALLLSPILFFLFLFALKNWISQRKELSPALHFCGVVTCVSLLFTLGASFFQKIQGNWIILAYPTGFILLGWSVIDQYRSRESIAKVGLGFSIVTVILLTMLPTLASFSYAPAGSVQLFKHNMGGEALTKALEGVGYEPKNHFLVGDKYQTTSVLSFYGPGQKRAYFLNLQGARNNQFSYWPSLQEEQQGKTGYFAWIENGSKFEKNSEVKRHFYQEELQHYFDKVNFVASVPLVHDGEQVAKGALIFECQNCKPIKTTRSSFY